MRSPRAVVFDLWNTLADWPDDRVAVFSATCGLMKPDPRIYRLVTDELSVEPEECLYVGDGAHDELAGAARMGMQPVLIHRSTETPLWSGRRISSIPEVLDLL